MIKFYLNRIFLPILLFCLSLIPLIDLLHPGLPITHDGQDHVARIANFYQNLKSGVLVPRWAENLNWGYGHPVLMFLYPLSSYAVSLIHFSGIPLVDSTKVFFALAYSLSGFTMFLWLKEFLSRRAAFFGGILYMFAPYRFVDLYVRGAIGEHFAFIFPPLIFYYLIRIVRKKSYSDFFFASIFLSALILSHNAISIMFLPLIILYILFLAFQLNSRKRFLLSSLGVFIFGFCLSAFFWIPAYFEGKYTLRDIVTAGGYLHNFGSFSQLIYGPWSYGISGQFTLQVGIFHWLFVILVLPFIISLYKKRNPLWIMIVGLLFIFSLSLFLIDKNSRLIWDNFTLLQKFQFPWRLLSLSVFTSSVLGAIVIEQLPKKILTPVLAVLTLAVLFLNRDYYAAKGYQNYPEKFYSSVYFGTTDTGESAPVWSVRFMEKEPAAHLEVISGKAKLKEIERTSVLHRYQVDVEEKMIARENTLYFPGWQVLSDNKPVDIQFQDQNSRGLITFPVDKGLHDLRISFTETKLRVMADVLSIFSISLLLLFFIPVILLWRRYL